MGSNKSKQTETVRLEFFKSNSKRYLKRKFNNYAKQGIDYNVVEVYWDKTKEHILAIHYVSAVGSVKALQLLLQNGTDVNSLTKRGHSPFHYAVIHQNYDAYAILIDCGGFIDEKEHNSGYTPLHYAVENNDFTSVKLLLKLHADPNVKNHYKKTPVDISREQGYQSIEKLLMTNIEFTPEQLKDIVRSHRIISQSINQLYEKVNDLGERTSKYGSIYGINSFPGFPDNQARNRIGSFGSMHYGSRGSLGTQMSYHESGIGTGEYDGISQRSFHTLTGRTSYFSYPEAERIQECFEHLILCMNHTVEIIHRLFTRKHIGFQLKEKLKQLHGSDKNEELLDNIMRGNKATFDDFVLALRETKQNPIADLLQPDFKNPLFSDSKSTSLHQDHNQATDAAYTKPWYEDTQIQNNKNTPKGNQYQFDYKWQRSSDDYQYNDTTNGNGNYKAMFDYTLDV